jgi:hypothetical protein
MTGNVRFEVNIMPTIQISISEEDFALLKKGSDLFDMTLEDFAAYAMRVMAEDAVKGEVLTPQEMSQLESLMAQSSRPRTQKFLDAEARYRSIKNAHSSAVKGI